MVLQRIAIRLRPYYDFPFGLRVVSFLRKGSFGVKSSFPGPTSVDFGLRDKLTPSGDGKYPRPSGLAGSIPAVGVVQK
jgi:hypothetical protein